MILGPRRQKLPDLPIPENKRSIPTIFNIFWKGLVNLLQQKERSLICILRGKTAKEILVVLGVTENTLKFHNKNIYNKLGVSSRKQLLRYATLMKQQEENDQQ